jgi:hypothetical protein
MGNALEELIFLNKLSEDVVIFGKKIRWHTLDGDEFVSALQSTPAYDDFTRVQLLKVEKLARAIESIDGQTWLALISKEKQAEVTPLDKAREVIRKWQRNVIDYIYMKYESLEQKSNQQLQELDKSFLAPTPNSDGDGK